MARPPLSARPPADPAEEHTLRRLVRARHAPASWIQRARIVTASWDGARVPELAHQVGCHPQTGYTWLHRFNTGGIDALGDAPRPGVPRRITEHERGHCRTVADQSPRGRCEGRSQPIVSAARGGRIGKTALIDYAESVAGGMRVLRVVGIESRSTGGLTPQELQVVRRAALGKSNREIAAELFLSPPTVGHHLYKAYPKLGVKRRAELGQLDL